MLDLGLSDTCRASKRDGMPCSVRALAHGFCIFHDPDDEARERRVRFARIAGKASVRARRERKKRARALGSVELRTIDDAKALLERTVNENREGTLDVTRARIQLKAATSFLKHALAREVEERVVALESIVKDHEIADPEMWKGALDAKRNAWRKRG